MSKSINVLVVEDSELDTQLLLQELRRNGYEPTHSRVDTAERMHLAFQQRNWDVVLSDFSMPRFSGGDALEMLVGSNLDIPFIFVSGTLGEEAAVRMMKAGASDYFIKGNLSRLVPAIEREMEAAQKRRDRSRAEAAMHHLAAIVDSSEDAIYSVNLDSLIISWNQSAQKIYGYRAEEIIGRSITVLFPLSRRDELLETLAHLRLGQLVEVYETERQRKDGLIIPISMTTSPIKNTSGKIIGASVIARDISRQRQNEEDQMKLIAELTVALRHVRSFAGSIPVCAYCKRIRDKQNQWLPVEEYIAGSSNTFFTHGICPECSGKFGFEVGQKS
jgi:two-component system, cell cycle sensor histidine kinase and response regulator CckA